MVSCTAMRRMIDHSSLGVHRSAGFSITVRLLACLFQGAWGFNLLRGFMSTGRVGEEMDGRTYVSVQYVAHTCFFVLSNSDLQRSPILSGSVWFVRWSTICFP
ncbi:uncharacterized protein F5Z01DRAFT_666793 [Emericellopsis atlantica]|uniref:Uncharacterized protein n=1 Tax=Emericellopsis atlantica TaxID=2614577 RepID=A0A9P8CK89_9HYPO|nr:uncharacterized protein F5Z01DRAFT_666793 [Emericellopsis atlantica]KAG9250304.1 hypothetical protein F5Z01DRAFT_666793 [Emericellopsis atlantica]